MSGPVPIASVLPQVLSILTSVWDSVPIDCAHRGPTGVSIVTADDRPETVASLLAQAVTAGLLPSVRHVASLKVNGTRVIYRCQKGE